MFDVRQNQKIGRIAEASRVTVGGAGAREVSARERNRAGTFVAVREHRRVAQIRRFFEQFGDETFRFVEVAKLQQHVNAIAERHERRHPLSRTAFYFERALVTREGGERIAAPHVRGPGIVKHHALQREIAACDDRRRDLGKEREGLVIAFRFNVHGAARREQGDPIGFGNRQRKCPFEQFVEPREFAA